MKVTIKEIAEIAGVHRSTVDKVLHGRVGVSDEVREKIQKIIDELEYKPNVLGRALQMQQHPKTIAAVLLDVDSTDFIIKGIEKAKAEYSAFGFNVEYHVAKSLSPSEQVETIEHLIKKQVDGIIISPINTKEVRKSLERALQEGIPVITTHLDIEDSSRLCFIGQNMVRAGRVAGRLMKEYLGGEGKVAIFTNSDHLLSVKKREIGFKKFIETQAKGIDIVKIIETKEDPLITFKGAMALLKEEPQLDGIYITCGCVKELGNAVRLNKMQGRLKVISFENYPEILELMEDETITTTIAGDLTGQGYYPMKYMFEHIVYDREMPKEPVETAIEIIVREAIY